MAFYLVTAITALLIGSGLGALAYAIFSLLQERRRDRVPALLYHHFAADPGSNHAARAQYDPVYFCFDRAFHEQMSYLHREGYTTISMDDFVDFQAGQKTLPPKSIILTFDDGFASNYFHAFPILKKYGFAATIFVTVDSQSENFKKYAALDSPLTPKQLREMQDYGVSIESHTMTHRYLTQLALDEVGLELRDSKRILEEIIGTPVQFLAIPSGAYNRHIKRQVKAAGYRAAFCMRKGTNNRNSDPYALKRLVVARDFTIDDFKKLLRPATACKLRILSALQDLLFNTLLGPQRCDALRARLYHSRAASLLIRGQLKHLVGSLAVAVLAVLLTAGLILYYAF